MSSLPTTPAGPAAQFPTPTREEWLELVAKVLKGAPFDRLVHRTYDGIEVQPIYASADVPTSADESGFPGFDPHTRGASPAPRPDGQWEIRAPLWHPDPAEANRHALEELTSGSTGLEVRFDEAFRRGIGPADASFAELGAVDGVAVHSLDALDRLLDGVHLDLAPVTLAPGASFERAAEWLAALWERRGTGGAEVSGGLGADPISVLATQGELAGGLDASLAATGALAARTAAATPNVRAVTIDLGWAVEAGASEVQQLALMAATGAEYLRAMEAAGLPPAAAAGQIEIVLVLDADVFAGICTLRAARRVWSAVLDACGVPEERAATRVSVRTAQRMMTRRDPWVNLLRVTAASFAAAVGGADAVEALPYDLRCGFPSDLGRRMARNTQLLLAEESHVGAVLDPAGGAFYPEALTEEYAERAWAELARLDGSGGVSGGLADGSIQQLLAQTWEARRRNIAKRKDPVTGVSEFPHLAEAPVSSPEPNRDKVLAAVAADASASAVDRHVTRDGEALNVDPVPSHRFAEDFEALRDASDAHLTQTGARPKVFLASLGKVAEHTARTTWARNFFEAGGIEALVSDGYADAESAAAAFAGSGATIACLCSSDAGYERLVGEVAPALKQAGATHLYLAGNPGERRGADEAAGIDTFVHVGVDAVGVLTDAQQILGVQR